MPLDKLILEGLVSISSEEIPRPSQHGQFVFKLMDRREWAGTQWTFAVEYPNFKLPLKFLLSSQDLRTVPYDFLERASEGYFCFYHHMTKSRFTLTCNPLIELNLEDAVILIMSIKNRKSFEMQKAEMGFLVHETFLKAADTRRRRYGGRPMRNRGDRRGSFSKPYQVPDKEQFYNGGFKGNSVEYKRNDNYYGSRGKTRSPQKRFNGQSMHNGKINGFRDRRSLESPSEQYRNREHVSRRQQPLTDRGSAENSLDRSEAERNTSNVQNENDDPTAQESSNCSSETFGSSVSSLNSLSSPSSSREIDKSSTKVDSESPFIRGTFYGKVNSNRQLGPVKSFSSYRSPVSSFQKRTNTNLNPISPKKNKLDASNFENKENELDASCSSIRPILGCEPGFKNIGMTCYMNTSLWSLFNVDVFSKDLLLAYISIKHSLADKSILKSVCNLLVATRSHDKSKCGDNYKSFLENLSSVITAKWKGFNVRRMQDAQEFIQQILNSMKDEIEDALKVGKPSSSYSTNPIKKNFEFEMEEATTCCNCSKMCRKREIHYDMGLGVPKSKDFKHRKSLQTAIKSFFKVEEREAVCSSCQHNKCKVETRISKLPYVLVTYLKRYKTHKISKLVTKNEHPVDIPKYVTLGDFTLVGTTLGGDKCDRTSSIESCSTVDATFAGGNSDNVQGLGSDDTALRRLSSDSGVGSQSGELTETIIDLTHVPDVDGDGLIDEIVAGGGCGDGKDHQSTDHKRTSTPVDENPAAPMHLEWPVGVNEEEDIKEAISKSLEQSFLDDDDEIEKAKRLSLQDLSNATEQQEESDDEEEEIEDDDESDLSNENFSTGDLPDSYRLVSVATHTGTLINGHYKCINYTTDSKWKLYDDDKVCYRNEKEAMDLARENGYVMIYIHKSLVGRRGNV